MLFFEKYHSFKISCNSTFANARNTRMPTPLKNSFNILNTFPNYPSCQILFTIHFQWPFCSVRSVYTLNKKNHSARFSNEILLDNYTRNYEQNLPLLFGDHHRSVLYCFCYHHLKRPQMGLLRLCWMLHFLRLKEIFFFPFSSWAFAVWGPGWHEWGHINPVKHACKCLLKKIQM